MLENFHTIQLGIAESKRREELRKAKERELKDPSYLVDSTLTDYLQATRGLRAIFDRIRSGPVRKALELGIGQGIATSKPAGSQIAADVSVIGTGLVTQPDISQSTLLYELTSAENLAFRDESFGGVLSVSALGLSHDPRLAIDNIDRVLVPGGVIKATFRKEKGSYGRKWDRKYNKWGYKTHDPFSQVLDRLGYDLVVKPTEEGDDILVAIKPGSIKATSAEELFELDSQSLPQQLESVNA